MSSPVIVPVSCLQAVNKVKSSHATRMRMAPPPAPSIRAHGIGQSSPIKLMATTMARAIERVDTRY
eukprot:4133965-Prymnesium_polylepis.1